MNTWTRRVFAGRVCTDWVCTGWVLAGLFWLSSAWMPGTLYGEARGAPEPLSPGSVRQGRLAEGESHLYRFRASTGQRFRVRVDQLGVDTELEARWAGGSLRIDSPLDREGVEVLLLPAEVRGEVELAIRGLATATGPGRYRLQVEGLEGGDEIRAALEAMTEAGREYAEGGSEGRRRALGHYRDAVGRWRDLHRPRLAAQCLYSVAVLHRLLGNDRDAFELARETLPLWRSFGDVGREADTLNEMGLSATAEGRVGEAREIFGQALVVQRRAGDLFRQAATTNNLCLTYLYEGENRRAIQCYTAAFELFRSAGDDETEAVALTNLGWAHKTLGEPEEALDDFRRAVALHHAAGREQREAETLNNLALLHQDLAEPQPALDFFLRALEIFRRQGARRWEGRVLHNLGTCYHRLGDPERALVFYRRALVLRRDLGDLRGEATTLEVLGRLELEAGRAHEARELFHRALVLERKTEDPRGEAVVVGFLGEAEAALGEPRRALDFFDRSLESLGALDDRPAQAWVLLQRGSALLALERFEEASKTLARAVEIYHSLGRGLLESSALTRSAEAERAVGHAALAMTRADRAIGIFESLATRVGDPDLRATFGASVRDAYGLKLELLLARFETDGDPRDLHLAFETSERSRAAGLLELLNQAAAEISDPEMAELEGRLGATRRQLHVRAAQRRKLLARGADETQLTPAEAAFFEALAKLEGLEAERRRRSPRYAELVGAGGVDTAEIQRQLGAGTVLLEYALGERQSVLFRVDHEMIRAFELPPRDVIETQARRVYEASSTPHGVDGEAARLSEMLLAPALEGLVAERLVIVADGALHYLPFAVLPIPAEDAKGRGSVPLLQRYEVAHLPSASVLLAERRRSSNREPATRWAVVLADPVFDRHDRRLPRLVDAGAPAEDQGPGPETSVEAKTLRQPLGLELPRLRRSRLEAEAIAAQAPPGQAPPGQVLVAMGFDADRSWVLGGGLADYQIVHFATHGVIDARYPALSGLALSHYDREGRAQDGFLRLRDIYALELKADLVVLSACRTALGQEVRGEGLVGLVRGFFHAGARQVVASLWSVPDHATAELMTRFYRAMAGDQLSPAAALRRAQLSMLGERRWRDPHNWAGFVILGDWR